MDRVADFESVGWGFESLVPHQKKYTPFGVYFFVCQVEGLEPERASSVKKTIVDGF